MENILFWIFSKFVAYILKDMYAYIKSKLFPRGRHDRKNKDYLDDNLEDVEDNKKPSKAEQAK